MTNVIEYIVIENRVCSHLQVVVLQTVFVLRTVPMKKSLTIHDCIFINI